MLQLVNASQGKGPSDNAVDFMLSVIRGVEPRDQVEAMLAAQMAAVHMASMTFARRLAHVEHIPQQEFGRARLQQAYAHVRSPS